jgi:hypothetical protein
VKAAQDRHLWAERYDRPLKDIFAVQDEIVQKIVTTLKLQLTLQEQQGLQVRRRTENLEAYDTFLRGLEASSRAAYEASKSTNNQTRQLVLASHLPTRQPLAVTARAWRRHRQRWHADAHQQHHQRQ